MPDCNKPNNKLTPVKKIVLWTLVFIMALAIVSGVLFYKTKPAEAQFADVGQAIMNAFKIPYDITMKAYKTRKDLMGRFSAIAYKNAIKNFFSRLAYEGASNMASSMTGQKPAFETNIAKSIQQQADGALGDYLNDTVGKMWGRDLCQPLNPLAKVSIEMTARKILEPEKPQCKSSKIRENLQKLKLNNLVEFSSYFNPSGNDLGALLTITSGAIQKRKKVEEAGRLRKLVEGEFKPITGIIDNDVVRTPAGLQGAYYAGLLDKSLIPYGVYTGDAVADALGVFTNTLTSKLLQHYLSGIYQGNSSGGGGVYSPSFSNAQAIREQFADLAQVDYNFSGPVDVLNNLSCGTESQFSCTIDTQLRTAIEQKLTVQQAFDQGLLHGAWPIGYRADKSGGTDGARGIYSYRTLQILRKYRIIPVGWELAAEYFYKFDKSGQAITLNRLLGTEDQPGLVKDITSPYYKLIDPAWVLKAPVSICEKQGPGELAESETIPFDIDFNHDGDTDDPGESREFLIRKDYCADERQCIKESDNGKKCEQYGYCVKEESIYRLGPDSDQCLPVYNTCRSYQTRDGQRVNYLYNTLQSKNNCTEEDVGCREYCRDWDETNYNWSCTLADGNRRYLNKNASDNSCDEKEAGCSEFARMSATLGSPSNLIPNSSFEYIPLGPVTFGVQYDTSFVGMGGGGEIINTNSYSGSQALDISGNIFAMTVDTGSVLGGRTFTLSVYYYGGEVNLGMGGSPGAGSAGSGWQRAELSRTYDIGDTSTQVVFSVNGSVIIDAVSLVEADQAVSRNYGGANKVNFKKAPSYLNCQGWNVIVGADKNNCTAASNFWRDDIQKCVQSGSYTCDDYALYCDAGDADCRFYNPASYSGPNVPGVATPVDYCPAECVGYKTYQQQQSYFDQASPADVDLIASSATTCPANHNGCEEFTNLSEGPAGERKEYYSKLRYCVLPNNANIETYYSWASSEEAGNQLRSWQLLRSRSEERRVGKECRSRWSPYH